MKQLRIASEVPAQFGLKSRDSSNKQDSSPLAK
jgi:hypothetical protein